MDTYLGSTGIKLGGVCDHCSGEGEIALTNRAATWPKHYPAELERCTNCNGLGGDTVEAGRRGRAAGRAYFEALGLDEVEASEPPHDPRTKEQAMEAERTCPQPAAG